MAEPNANELLEGEEYVALARIKVSVREALRILIPYISSKLWEQFCAVAPLVAYLILFQVFILGENLEQALQVGLGVALVIIGLAFFMEGVRLGLIPFAERIGAGLPRRATLPIVLGFAFMLGAGATLAEPAVGVIKASGKWIDPNLAPLLYYILQQKIILLVIAVGVGVGLAALFGILRIVKNFSLIPVLIPLLIVTILLSFICMINPRTSPLVGVAWDTGGVIVGPVTLPLILSVGFGLATAAGRADVGKSGFGIAGLAALFPVATILAMGIAVHYLGIAGDLRGTVAQEAVAGGGESATILAGLTTAFLAALQAFPLILFLYLVLNFFVRAIIYNREEVYLGIVFALIGVFLLNAGISLGLSVMGQQTGEVLPRAFYPEDAAIFTSWLGKLIAVIFAFILGYVATICEPAFVTLAIQVEEITVGAIRKKLLIQVVSLGVGLGAGVGVFKLLNNIALAYFVIPLYLIAFVFSLIGSDEFVSIAWDAGACTTGAITVPLIVAIGLGLSKALGIVEGFGIIALATIFPILAVMSLGFLARRLHSEPEEATIETDAE